LIDYGLVVEMTETEWKTIAVSGRTKKRLDRLAATYAADMSYHDVVRELVADEEVDLGIGDGVQISGAPDNG
jgi:short subunit dehydrogenase-like uncharacterized protein